MTRRLTVFACPQITPHRNLLTRGPRARYTVAMTDDEPTPEPQPDTDAGPPAAPAAPRRRGRWIRIVLFLAALAFGGWGLWTTFAPVPEGADAVTPAQRARTEALKQRVATLARSDQISRDANRDLQGTLAERDEEIAGLRADVAFYERFVGATGQRRGLSVHELHLQPQAGQAWRFTATLTQNLNRGAVSSGTMTLAVEGSRDGKLQTLAWADLRQQPDAPGVAYSFKYFQEIEGELLLPPGFKPLRITVTLDPKGGSTVEQSFAWADATRPATGAG